MSCLTRTVRYFVKSPRFVVLPFMLLACAHAKGAVMQTDATQNATLIGVWQIQLRCMTELCSSRLLGSEVASRHVALAPVDTVTWKRLSFLVGGEGTPLMGVYDQDVPVRSVETGNSDDFLVIATVATNDSVEIDFNPSVDHGGITLLGHLSGDSVVGTWFHRSGTGGHGEFSMSRYPPTR